MDGVINIYKETGYTSHDVVARLRGICKQKRIGHTGTLDPDAEGVLPICLGKATRLCDFLTDKSKIYKVVMQLGITTDTQDISGNITEEAEVTANNEEIKAVMNSFIGGYSQIPPMYSAIKVHGRRLYELARQGIEIERQPRKIQIYSIDIEDFFEKEECIINDHGELEKKHEKCVSFTVKCSKGTYVRTLCHDIGIKLGCGACMKQLLRIEASGFSINDSRKISEIEELNNNGTLESVLIAIEKCLNYPHVFVNNEGDKLLCNGNYIPLGGINGVKDFISGQKYLIFHTNGEFAAVYIYDGDSEQFKAYKMF